MFGLTEWDKLRKVFVVIADVLIAVLAYFVSFYLRFGFTIPEQNFHDVQSAFFLVLIGFVFINILSGIYVFYNKTIGDLLFITLINQILMSFVTMALTFMGRWFAFPRSVILVNIVVGTLFLFVWRVAVFKLYNYFTGVKRVMIVGREDEVLNAIDNFKRSKSGRHEVTHVVLSDYEYHVTAYLNQVDIVYFASNLNEETRIKLFDKLMREGKKIFLNTGFSNMVYMSPNIMSIEDESMIELSMFSIPPEAELIKRFFDILIALILLVLTAPIMLITALLIKQDSPGGIFYKQTRITKGNKEFDILKFRSMSATAEKDSGPVLSTSNDMRVTKIGKYIRSLRIDELPQLINVLKGDMSLVGPRPERPFFVDQFKQENPYYYLRHNVRAGITGYAQVYGKYASNFNSKLNFDLIYIKKYSLLLDMKIMLQTIKILFDKVSSRGLDAETPHVYSLDKLGDEGIRVIY
ncbi:sugar transferase [Atopobacter phocae]|uniref:sugar transferase n=1 Tax=Atopobacter phocae TaxID=136492 RepID=UPI00046F80CB|nr:sugar transferase [Atopobacter phocae]